MTAPSPSASTTTELYIRGVYATFRWRGCDGGRIHAGRSGGGKAVMEKIKNEK